MEGSVTVSRRGADRLAAGHLWIYRSDVEKAGRGLAAGDVVAVKDGRGRFLAKAWWSEKSQIALRIVTRDEEPVDDAFLAARIDQAASLRELTLPGVTAARIVHGESDLLPGLVADRYGEVVVVQTLVPATDRRKETIAALLAERLGARTVVERNDVRVRELEGLAQTKGVLRGPAPAMGEYREGEVRLALDVLGGQKTGAFLDQRENHLRAGEYARGRCLDCFSYAGGFALQLARRAEHVTAVEMQGPAAALLRANAALNGTTNLDVVEGNAFDHLPAARRGYKEINLRALQILKPGGVLVTASCSYHMQEAELEALVLDAANDAGRRVQVLERRGAGRDHPALLGVPETRYLKCFFLRVL